jgi:hypothetical protein
MFLPSFFGMSNDFPVRTAWIYASVAVPLSVCALLIFIYAARIGRGLMKVKERLRWKGGRKDVKW